MMRAREIEPFSDFSQSASGLWLPQDFKRCPVGLDLFSGCGGFSVGCLQAGFEILAGVEWDCAAATTYLMNLGAHPMQITFITPEDEVRMEKFLSKEWKRSQKRTKGGLITDFYVTGSGYMQCHPEMPPVRNFFFGDIRKLTSERICDVLGVLPGEIDCIMGGPPCQGFSIAGKRDVMDPRSSLVFEFTRVVRELKPKSMVMENVPAMAQMTTPEGINVIDAIAMDLERGGFSLYDSIRKSLLGKDARAAVRTPKNVARKAAADREDSPDDEPEEDDTPGLFDEVEATA